MGPVRSFITQTILASAVFVGCTDQTVDRPVLLDSAGTGAPAEESGPPDAGTLADARGAEDAARPLACTNAFGAGITAGFGRLDGVVRAVIVPGDPSCRDDDDHVIVQVDAAGATYPVWINVDSNIASERKVRFFELHAPLEGGSWDSGWHPSMTFFDYAVELGVESPSFSPKTIAELGALISARAKPGTRVSVFAHGFSSGDGAHKVHRNSAGQDGAMIVDPTGSPTYLLFAFSDQVF